MKNIKKYKQIYANILKVSEEELGDLFTYKSRNDWDSISHMTLIAELEEAFDVFFETEDILHFESYENGMKILAKYGVNFDD